MNDGQPGIKRLAKTVLAASRELKEERRSFLAGISGIDSGGKGWVTAKLAEELQNKGVKVATVNLDGWLNLPHIRFDPQNPARHFYEHGFRFEELFGNLIEPLKAARSISLTADFAEETATGYRKHIYEFDNIEIILLEGIFLFKKAFRGHFDLKIWIECSFETALKRAIRRAQEGLPPDETIKAFQTIYFPAQEIHFAVDDPRNHVDLIYNNDRESGRSGTLKDYRSGKRSF